jgi:hypothetical protein
VYDRWGPMADRADLFFPLGAVHYLNGHRLNMCPRAKSKRKNRTTLDTEMGRPVGDALRSRGADVDSVGCRLHVHVVAHMALKAPLVLEVCSNRAFPRSHPCLMLF